METQKIRSFTDLIVWKEAHKLVIMIYKVTKNFPREETYSLIDQMKRCSVSISSNISEGFSRQTKKEKVQFYFRQKASFAYFMAKGSLTELQNQLLVARDIGYLPKDDFDKAAHQTILVHKLLNGLIKTSETKK